MAQAARRSGIPVVPPTSDELPPLVEAKLGVPRLRPQTLPRPRLVRSLGGAAGAPLTLVSAPPGYGKTTAVRAWCASRASPSAWVTLDTRDNDPNRMWRYVATAVDRIRGGLGRGALQRLPRTGGSIESAIDELTNALASYGEECVIVLDDAHTVTDPDCLACLDYFVEHLPDAARLVLITRSDPPLRLARLRSRRASGRAPSGRARVHERRGTKPPGRRRGTDAGAAGGRDAPLAHRGLARRARSRRDLAGQRRLIPPGRFASSEATSASSPITSPRRCCSRSTPTCEGFCCEPPSWGASRRRCATQCSTAPIRRPCWPARACELPRHAARARALVPDPLAVRRVRRASSWPRSTPAAERVLNRRAAEWLYAQRRPVEAAEHAARAGEYELVARLLAEHHLVLIRTGGARTLLQWVREIPDEQLLGVSRR